MDLISPYRLLCVALILYGRVLCNEHVPKYDAHDEPPKYGDTLATSGYLGPARDVGYIGHGPQNNGWLRSSYQDEEIKHMSLPKKVFKNYVSAKDRLFFNYLDIYLGNSQALKGKVPNPYHVMTNLMKRRRGRPISAAAGKDDIITSTYALRGNSKVALEDLNQLLTIASNAGIQEKVINQTSGRIGPYHVELKNDANEEDYVEFYLDEKDGIAPGSIVRKLVYRKPVVKHWKRGMRQFTRPRRKNIHAKMNKKQKQLKRLFNKIRKEQRGRYRNMQARRKARRGKPKRKTGLNKGLKQKRKAHMKRSRKNKIKRKLQRQRKRQNRLQRQRRKKAQLAKKLKDRITQRMLYDEKQNTIGLIEPHKKIVKREAPMQVFQVNAITPDLTSETTTVPTTSIKKTSTFQVDAITPDFTPETTTVTITTTKKTSALAGVVKNDRLYVRYGYRPDSPLTF